MLGGPFRGLFKIFTIISPITDTNPKKENNSIEKGTDIVTDYFSTMLLTATNPTVVMTFTVLFAMTTSGFSGGSYNLATILVVGVFLGATMWWLTLCLGIGQVKRRVKNFSLEMVDKISGVVTILFAIIILISAILK